MLIIPLNSFIGVCYCRCSLMMIGDEGMRREYEWQTAARARDAFQSESQVAGGIFPGAQGARYAGRP